VAAGRASKARSGRCILQHFAAYDSVRCLPMRRAALRVGAMRRVREGSKGIGDD
jgi:hypothetical protein